MKKTQTPGSILSLTLMAWGLSCGLLASAAPASTETATFKVATFNIRCPVDKSPNSWQERAPKCRDLIIRHKFDLIGLQEATWGQIKDLLELDGWNYIGGCRDDGKRQGEASCIFYRDTIFDLLDSGTFWLSETPEVPGSKSWESACRRICTWGKFRQKATGRIFLHFNTHLDHRSPEARLRGMELILQRIAEYGRGYPVLFSGDFNCHPTSAPYQLAVSQLKDSIKVSQTPHSGPVKTFQAFKFKKVHEGEPIDYLLVSDDIKVLTHATLDDSNDQLYPSDHFPVAIEVVLP